MQVFIGQTRSRKLIAELTKLGFGECTNRGEWPPRRYPNFLDNGAFSDWTNGRRFDQGAFLSNCESANVADIPPVFVVCPDRVATGLDSLAFSLDWLDSHASKFPALSWYLAVQDGMEVADVRAVMHRFAGVFIGGSLPWKIATGAQWVSLVHDELGKRCHIGRVGTTKRVRWAMRIGADSIDSCTPLWAAANLQRFVNALEARQGELL